MVPVATNVTPKEAQMGEKVEYQGYPVELTGDNEVEVPEQGRVIRTDSGRYATEDAASDLHGYVPSTQVRDILDGARDAKDDGTAAKPPVAQAESIPGSEAASPTGDTQSALATSGLDVAPAAGTDHNPTLDPAKPAELKTAKS